VFVDPDTGIAASASVQHITAAEIEALATKSNVVAVYQHAHRKAEWMTDVVARVHATGLHALGYVSGSAGMVFATKDPVRRDRLRTDLATRLGSAAKARGEIPGRLIEWKAT